MLCLTNKQARAWLEILDDPEATRILFDGGARSGKTVLVALWICNRAASFPGSRHLVARKARNAAKASLFDETFRSILRDRREFRFLESELEIRHENGSRILIEGLDDQERVDKILGREFETIFVNEATQVSAETNELVLTRLSGCMTPERKAIYDCNPKGTRHWLYRAGVMAQDSSGAPLPPSAAEKWRRLSWTPYDNPNLSPDYLASLEALSGITRRRMLLGEWCNAEGSVYGEEFDEEVHGFDNLPPGSESWELVRGIDFGFTNPFVCLFGLVDPDGCLWIIAERYVRKVIVADHARAIRATLPGRAVLWTVADHDAEDRATLEAAGIPSISARKAILPGIERVKARLRKGANGKVRLRISRSGCPELLAEFLDYSFPPSKGGERGESETPAKERDHAMDALRYMIAQLDAGEISGPSGAA